MLWSTDSAMIKYYGNTYGTDTSDISASSLCTVFIICCLSTSELTVFAVPMQYLLGYPYISITVPHTFVATPPNSNNQTHSTDSCFQSV